MEMYNKVARGKTWYPHGQPVSRSFSYKVIGDEKEDHGGVPAFQTPRLHLHHQQSNSGTSPAAEGQAKKTEIAKTSPAVVFNNDTSVTEVDVVTNENETRVESIVTQKEDRTRRIFSLTKGNGLFCENLK